MAYKTITQDGPDWLPKIVVCRVWNQDNKHASCIMGVIGVSSNGFYIDTTNNLWDHAEPQEAWELQEGEWVIAWYDGSEHIVIGKYVCKQEERYAVGHYSYPHIARLKNPDGSMVDLDCTIDELKQRTEWK